jgi:hypothetical protein
MWNSPRRTSRKGKRYSIQELEVLIHPLDQLLVVLDSSPVSESVGEPILKRMEKDELVYSLYEVFQALLEDTPVPKEGHTGYQEAIIAELLDQTLSLVQCERDDANGGDSARLAALRSFKLLAAQKDENGKSSHWMLDDTRIDLDSPRAHRSTKLTDKIWSDLLLTEGGLWDEFFWDDDWRMDALLDAHPAAAKSVTQMAGIDLQTLHRLPHTPTPAETRMADQYLRYIIWKSVALNQ